MYIFLYGFLGLVTCDFGLERRDFGAAFRPFSSIRFTCFTLGTKDTATPLDLPGLKVDLDGIPRPPFESHIVIVFGIDVYRR